MASWWQGLDDFFDDFFGYVRQMNQNPVPQGDPSIDWLMDFIRNGPPSPSWSASDDQIRQFEYMFSNIPGYGDWVRARDNLNFMSDYLKNYGLTWADMLYPSLNRGAGSGWGVLNFMSSNIEKFYKNH